MTFVPVSSREACAFNWQSGGDVRLNASAGAVSALTTTQVPAVSYAVRLAQTGANGWGVAVEESHTLDAGTGQAVALVGAQAWAVRRLTPRECERLQGFPDDFTAVGAGGRPLADAARYRLLGNAVCVPVARWIGSRIRDILDLDARGDIDARGA